MVQGIQGAGAPLSNHFAAETLSPKDLKHQKSLAERSKTHAKNAQKTYTQAKGDYEKAKAEGKGSVEIAEAKKRYVSAKRNYQHRYKIWAKYNYNVRQQEYFNDKANPQAKKRFKQAKEGLEFAGGGGIHEDFNSYKKAKLAKEAKKAEDKKVAQEAVQKNFGSAVAKDTFISPKDLGVINEAVKGWKPYSSSSVPSSYLDSEMLQPVIKNRKTFIVGI